ncbi:hypothetical protein EJB05_55682, partial [Eragrostis curvula]
MSQHGGNASGSRQASPSSDADADAVITKVDGEWNIQLRIAAPLQGQITDGQASGSATAQEMNVAFKGTLRLQDDESPEAQRKRWFKEMRGWLMVLATVAASDNPSDKSHHAGNPVLRDEHRSRYLVFYYFNATAFVTSLVIMVLLMSERFYHTENKLLALMFTTFVDLASLIGAYIAGTTRYFTSCIYIIVITCVAFVGVIYIGEVMAEICSFVMMAFPYMETLAQKRWCPIPKGAVEKAKKMKDDRKRRSEMRSNNGTCCSCCAAPDVAA